ncbi:hypothetical protein EB796_007783 [Bugula neritina]|uniref:Uncharacterized protein n=1 Tax=Bugula neritina TaxID=10212 RepID=A0A7J7K6R5_BUGNE|nr:hypothetical protein EB796_007783 [Bugula neritina]
MRLKRRKRTKLTTVTLCLSVLAAKAAKPSNAALASFAAAQQTLLVDHLLDVDHETLYLWVKSLTGCWPRVFSCLQTGRELVRVPTTVKLDVKKLEKMTSDINYHLHGERLAISDVLSTSQIQVICSSTKSTADVAAMKTSLRLTSVTQSIPESKTLMQ